jgi:hypothetical protein
VPAAELGFRIERHLDHRRAKARCSKQPLSSFVSVRCGEHDKVCASPLQLCDNRVEQHPADALIALLRIYEKIMNDACWSSKRHIVIPLERGIRVTNDHFFLLCGEDYNIRLFKLASQPPGIGSLRTGSRRDEAIGIPLMMKRHQVGPVLAEHRHIFIAGSSDRNRCWHFAA